jgi:hypothetical protein
MFPRGVVSRSLLLLTLGPGTRFRVPVLQHRYLETRPWGPAVIAASASAYPTTHG